MGQRADRNIINAAFGNGNNSVFIDTARGFQHGTFGSVRPPRAAYRAHIVEQHDLCATRQCFFKLRQRIDLDFNRHAVRLSCAAFRAAAMPPATAM